MNKKDFNIVNYIISNFIEIKAWRCNVKYLHNRVGKKEKITQYKKFYQKPAALLT